MDYKLILFGLILGTVAHAFSWFGMNSQFIWDFWKNKPLMAAIIFGLPSNMVFWFASKYIREGTHSIWNVRWLLFAMSFPPMFVLTTTMLGDSFLTLKNLITMILAVCIVIVQFYYRWKMLKYLLVIMLMVFSSTAHAYECNEDIDIIAFQTRLELFVKHHL